MKTIKTSEQKCLSLEEIHPRVIFHTIPKEGLKAVLTHA